MPDNLEVITNELGKKKINITNVEQVNDFLFIVLDNDQSILTNGIDLYDCSGYSHFLSMFTMNDRLCAVLMKDYKTCVVDLKTREVLYEDECAYHVSKQDNRTLHIIKKVGAGNDAIYDIETKKYLPAPAGYKFENSLGNNLYVFREENEEETDFYNYKRCVITAEGKFLLKDIQGWIYYSGTHLIIVKKDELSIIGIKDDANYDIKTLKQNESIIAKPIYHEGNIILIEKGYIKIFTPDLKLIHELQIAELEKIDDYEIVGDTLKLALLDSSEGKLTSKHLFVNLSTGKIISHRQIEGYPYWNPTTYVGEDKVNNEVSTFSFYDADFSLITKIDANSYESIESNKECHFILRFKDKKKLLNTKKHTINDVDYDYIHFHNKLPYGYGVKLAEGKMDFFDDDLNIIIPGFDYKKYSLGYRHEDFSYFIVNDYICIIKHIARGPRSYYRYIIQKASGEVILDSVEHKCSQIGNIIKITGEEDMEFLNTLTGERGTLGITAKTDDNGKIDFKQIEDFNNLLTINNNQLSLKENKEAKNKIRSLTSKKN